MVQGFGIISEYDYRMMACPFCHQPPELLHVEFADGDVWFRPQCSVCNCGWNENYRTKDEAVDAWNENLVKKPLFDGGKNEARNYKEVGYACD